MKLEFSIPLHLEKEKNMLELLNILKQSGRGFDEFSEVSFPLYNSCNMSSYTSLGGKKNT